MNEEPKSIWSRPWSGCSKTLGWFAVLTAATFAVIMCIGLASSNNYKVLDLTLTSLVLSVVIATLATALLWFLRWLCSWRNFRRFLFGVACFVTLIALIYAVENWRGKHAWDQHRREWEAKGEKFIIAELAPPPVPDEKNFALTPLLRPAMEFSHSTNGVVWADTNALARLQQARADLAPSPRRLTNDHLVLGNLEQGTFADLAACREFYRGNTNYPQPATAGTSAEDIVFALGKFDPELTELRTATVSRPLAHYPIEYEFEPSWAILLPHLANLKGLTQLTHVRATAALEAGRPAEALADLKVGFRISDSIRDEPILIDHLVRIACLAIDLQTLREGLLRHAWNEAQLTEFQTYLASVDLLAEYKHAMRGERAFNTTGLDYLRRQRFQLNEMDFLSSEDGGSASTPNPVLMPAGWFYQNMLSISEMHQEFILAAVDEKARRVNPGQCEALDSKLASLRLGPYSIFAKMLMPALSKAVRKSARMQFYVDAAGMACALERYRIANGTYPETPTALAPQFLEKIPLDVMDGKPIRYRRNSDGGYILYSVGWNQTDDGGELAWRTDKERSVDVARGDWVWFGPAK
jgi:hypothetical protein